MCTQCTLCNGYSNRLPLTRICTATKHKELKMYFVTNLCVWGKVGHIEGGGWGNDGHLF